MSTTTTTTTTAIHKNKKIKRRNVKTVDKDYCIRRGSLVAIDTPYRIDESDYDVLHEICRCQYKTLHDIHEIFLRYYIDMRKMSRIRDDDEDRRVYKLTVSELVCGISDKTAGALPDSIRSLDALEILDLKDAGNIGIPSWIGGLTNLKEIYLPRRGMELPEEIGNLTKLEVLQHYYESYEYDAEYEGFDVLPRTLENITTLKKLRIKVTTLPDWIGNLTNLEHLSVTASPMTHLPGSIAKLRKLKYFEIDCLWDLTVPDCIGKLTALEELYLSAGGLKSLPASIRNLGRLRTLRVESTKLRRLPKGIENLAGSLEVLHLRGMKGRGKPVRRLRTLTGLPGSVLGAFTNAKSLDFTLTNLSSVPAAVCGFSGLTALRLTGTKLKALPEDIGRLEHLERLCVSDVPTLTALPGSIGDLRSLRELDLNSTGLTSLPDSIGRLGNLRKLRLSETHDLKRLPDDFGKNLLRLEVLYLRNSGIIVPPDVDDDNDHDDNGSNSNNNNNNNTTTTTTSGPMDAAHRKHVRLHEQLRSLPSLREVDLVGSRLPDRSRQQILLATVSTSTSLLFVDTGEARLDDDINLEISRCLRRRQARFRILREEKEEEDHHHREDKNDDDDGIGGGGGAVRDYYFPPHGLWPYILSQAYYAYHKRYHFARKRIWRRLDTPSDDIFELLVEFGPRFLGGSDRRRRPPPPPPG